LVVLHNNKEAGLAALEFSFQQHALKLQAADADYVDYGYRLLDAYLTFNLLPEAAEFSETLTRQIGFSDSDPGAAPLLTFECELDRKKGLAAQGVEKCKRAIELLGADKYATPEGVRAFLELSNAYVQLRDYPQALSTVVESLNGSLTSTGEKFPFRELVSGLVENGLSALAEHPLADKDRAAADTILTALQFLNESDEGLKIEKLQLIRLIPDADTRHRAIYREYLRSREERAKLRLLDLSLSSASFQSGNEHIKSGVENELEAVAKLISALGPDDSGLKSAESVRFLTLDDIQEKLRDDENVIIYRTYLDQYYVVRVRKNAVSVKRIEAGSEELEKVNSGGAAKSRCYSKTSGWTARCFGGVRSRRR
jgi:hypothetical protein